MKRHPMLRKALIYFIFTCLISVIGGLWYHSRHPETGKSLFHVLNNAFFIVNTPLFLLAGFTLVVERGLFNTMLYSVHRVRATVSKKYARSLYDEHDFKTETEMAHYLKEKYLYADHKMEYTFPLLLSSVTIFGLLILSMSFYE